MKNRKAIKHTLSLGVLSGLLLTAGMARAQIGSGWTSMTVGGFIDYEVHDSHFQHNLTSFTNSISSMYYINSPPSETFALTTSSSNRTEHDTDSHYNSGSRQFQGDLQIFPGISNQSVLQIFNDTASGPIIMIKGYGSNNGTLEKQGGSVVLANNCFGRSIRVNVIHDLNANTIQIYFDGTQVYSGGGGLGGSFNLKYGLYGSFVNVAHSTWSNVQMWQGGTSSGCSPTPITPFLEVNGGSWQQTDTVTINSGDSVIFGPQPTSGGSWSWSGPNGFSSTSRQITVSSITTSGNYVATYVNDCGSSSSDTFAVTVNGGGIDPSAVYQLQNQSSGLSLNVSGASTSNGAKIIQWPFSGSANSEWMFTPTSNGYYQLVNVNSGLDAVVQSASTSAGAKIIQWSFGSTGDDQWQPVQNSDGSFTLFNLKSGLVLEDPGSSSSQGTQMDQWTANGGANQNWVLLKQ